MSALRCLLLGRRSPRLLFAAVFCAMVLNGIAYVAHQHREEPARSTSGHTELCGYCATLGSLASAPSAPAGPFSTLVATFLVAAFLCAAPVLRRAVTAARPRAPPAR